MCSLAISVEYIPSMRLKGFTDTRMVPMFV